MTTTILKRWPRFGNWLALFEAKLGKPALRHFSAILIAFIIYDGRKNLAGLNRALYAPCHLSSLHRFIGEVEWDENQFEQIRLAELNRQVRHYLDHQRAKGVKVPAFLCIDDTNNPKSGRQTRWASWQYSHLAGRTIRCYCLVTAVLVVGPFVIPLNFQLYRKKADCVALGQAELFQSKPDLAARLIEQWQPFCGTDQFVLVDSWYLNDTVLRVCQKRNFTLIGGLSANRSFRTAACPTLSELDKFAAQLPKEAYQYVKLGKQSFNLAGVEGYLKGNWSVKLIVSRLVSGSGPIKKLQYRYFVSSDPTLSVKTIAQFYAVRWEIETFHAQAKELLGLDHNQCWRERNVRRMWTLLLIAYSYLVCEQVSQAKLYTNGKAELASLGQVVQWHKREAHRAQGEWVYAQAQAGVPLEQVLAQIAA